MGTLGAGGSAGAAGSGFGVLIAGCDTKDALRRRSFIDTLRGWGFAGGAGAGVGELGLLPGLTTGEDMSSAICSLFSGILGEGLLAVSETSWVGFRAGEVG